MKFKAKLKKIGNGKHIYIPKEVYTNLLEDKEYEWEVYTEEKTNEAITEKVEKDGRLEWCKKHGVWKSTCQCQ